MRYLILLFTFLIISRCHQNYEYGKNMGDLFSKDGQIVFLLLKATGWTSGGSGGVNDPRKIFGFSDRIVVASQSYSSTGPYIWVSTDGEKFTKTSVKVGDCVGTSASSGSSNSTNCSISIVGYENGSYAIFGQKLQQSTNSSSVSAQYFKKATDLSSQVTLSSTSPGLNFTDQSNPVFLYSGGIFHLYLYKDSTTRGIYSTTDGSSWASVSGFHCNKIYTGDGGNPVCDLQKYYNGSTWVSAGLITGGGGQVYSSAYSVYWNNAYYAYPYNTTYSLYISTAGSISSGLTFPSSANATMSLGMNPTKAVRTSGGMYFMASTSSSNNNTTVTSYFYKSSDGASWTTINSSFPSELGTLRSISGASFAALGNTLFLVAEFSKSSNSNNSYLLKSSDGQTWTKVTLE